MVEKRVGLFIDGGYLDHIILYGFSGKINFRKLAPYVTNDDGKLLFGYYYTCLPHQNQIQNDIEKNLYAQSRKQIAHISKVPCMSVKLGKLQRKKNTFVQKKVDVLFALDLAKSAWKDEIDTAVLIAGDSDFVPAVDGAT
ncbi:MAG TPA: NYN domain-containing protein, partial [Methanocorpusculum sp.]|nr:NYN domain-containing protein [Methanocorpusculum sp.]